MDALQADFGEFYRCCKDDCLRTVMVSVGDQDTAQDLVAEAPATSSTAIPRSCRAPRLPDKANADLQEKIMPQPGPVNPVSQGAVVLNVRPSAIPRGIGLFIEAYAESPGSPGGQTFAMQTDLVQASQPRTGR